MGNQNKPILTYFLLIMAMLFWGSSFVWGKIALDYYSANTIIFLRLIISISLLLPILLLTKKFSVPKKRHFSKFLLLALFQPFLYFLGETNALSHLSASMTSVFVGAIPLLTPFAAYLFLKEKIRAINLIGITISVLGILILVLNKNMSLEVAPIGLALIALVILSANGYSIILKKIPAEYSLLNLLFWQNFLGAIYFLPIVIFTSGNDLNIGFQSNGIISIIVLGIFCSTLAFWFYSYALRHMAISRATVFTNTVPLFAIIIAVFTINESVDAKKLIGMLIVISGVVISQLKFRNRKK